MPPRKLKKILRGFLEEAKLEEVAEYATEEQGTLGGLIALTFDSDVQIVWRAIEAMGLSIQAVARINKPYAKEHMRRLYWLITEEAGAVFWRAPECMAECCASEPKLFKSHTPIAFHLLETLEVEDLEHFRPGTIWAIGRLIDEARDDLPAVLPLVMEALDRPDAQSRGMAVWCLGKVGETEALQERTDLLDDQGQVTLYRDRVVVDTTVGQITREVLAEAGQTA